MSEHHRQHETHSEQLKQIHGKHKGHSPKIFLRKFWVSFILTILAALFMSLSTVIVAINAIFLKKRKL